MYYYIRASIYLVAVILVFTGLESVNFNKILKTNKPGQARILYIMVGLALSELTGSFIIHFLEFSKII